MKLRPFANLFAVRHADPQMRERMKAALRASGRFAEIWCPAPSWLCAVAPLPDGEGDSQATRSLGLVFAEGRDELAGDVALQPRERLARVAALARATPERLAELPGDFGFFLFDADDSALVVRSCGGVVPFYEHTDGTTIAFGTRLDDFARFLPTPPAMDPLVLAISGGKPCFPDRRTYLKGVEIVPRGWTRRVTPTAVVAAIRYWNPKRYEGGPPPARVVREHAEQLRTYLLSALKRDLCPDGGNLLWLSGGVDSSALGALAAGTAKLPVWTWSLLPGNEDSYRNEMSFIEPLARQYGFSRRWEVRFAPHTKSRLLCSSPRTLHPQLNVGMGDLPRVLSEAPVKVVFGGEFADETCGSYCTVPDWATATSLPSVLGGSGTGASLSKDLGRWFKHRGLHASGRPILPFASELPALIRPELRTEYAEWLDRRRRAAGREIPIWRYLTLRLECDEYAPMNWAGTSALNLRRSFPFLQRAVIELAYSCHPSELVCPGHKLLLRRALESDAPVRNLNRADKGGWGRSEIPQRYSPLGNIPISLSQVIVDDLVSNQERFLNYWEHSRITQFSLFVENLLACQAERAF